MRTDARYRVTCAVGEFVAVCACRDELEFVCIAATYVKLHARLDALLGRTSAVLMQEC